MKLFGCILPNRLWSKPSKRLYQHSVRHMIMGRERKDKLGMSFSFCQKRKKGMSLIYILIYIYIYIYINYEDYKKNKNKFHGLKYNLDQHLGNTCIFLHIKKKKKACRPSISHISNPCKGIGDYESLMRYWIRNLLPVSWDHPHKILSYNNLVCVE